MNEKNIASHIAAGVAVVLALVESLHPGFKAPDAATVSSISLAAAGLIESINTFFHKTNSQKLAVVKALTEKALTEAATAAQPPTA